MTLEILTFIVVLAIIIAGALYGRWCDRRDWNGGRCRDCSTPWGRPFDRCSDGSRGYRCRTCHNIIWISWGVDRRVDP